MVRVSSDQYYYGVIELVSSSGTRSMILSGYNNTPTDTSGNIKTHKHSNTNGYDYQFVFPGMYTHGFVIIGGAASIGSIITGTY